MHQPRTAFRVLGMGEGKQPAWRATSGSQHWQALECQAILTEQLIDRYGSGGGGSHVPRNSDAAVQAPAAELDLFEELVSSVAQQTGMAHDCVESELYETLVHLERISPQNTTLPGTPRSSGSRDTTTLMASQRTVSDVAHYDHAAMRQHKAQEAALKREEAARARTAADRRVLADVRARSLPSPRLDASKHTADRLQAKLWRQEELLEKASDVPNAPSGRDVSNTCNESLVMGLRSGRGMCSARGARIELGAAGLQSSRLSANVLDQSLTPRSLALSARGANHTQPRTMPQSLSARGTANVRATSASTSGALRASPGPATLAPNSRSATTSLCGTSAVRTSSQRPAPPRPLMVAAARLRDQAMDPQGPASKYDPALGQTFDELMRMRDARSLRESSQQPSDAQLERGREHKLKGRT